MMSPVITSYDPVDGSLHIAYVARENRAYTTIVHRYRSGNDADGVVIQVAVPMGEPTDFASIPRCLWWLWPKLGPWGFAALIHDRLYRIQPCSRAQADAILLAIMSDFEIGWFDRYGIWLGVRIGGGYFWRKQAKRNAAAKAAQEPEDE